MKHSRDPVIDWMTDFDHYDPDWVSGPHPLWAQMRASGPVAHTSRYGGVCCPLTYDLSKAVALDTETFSSRFIDIRDNQVLPPHFAPPITSDPPDHRPVRGGLAPAFTLREIGKLEPAVRDHCRALLAGLPRGASFDASDYARRVPAFAVGTLLGVPADDVLAFQRWDLTARRDYILALVADRSAKPGDDLVSKLLAEQETPNVQYEGGLGGTLFLLLIAGVETTASVIGVGLLHLAADPGEADRLRADERLLASATEEFLRVTSPVSSARVATRETELGGVNLPAGTQVLLAYGAANRDPERFPDPDRVILDRTDKSHLAFGLGVHRCLGANLARMLVGAAIGEWLRQVEVFQLAADSPIEWSAGSVRGPKSLPLTIEK